MAETNRKLSEKELGELANELTNEDAQTFFRHEKRKGKIGLEKNVRKKFLLATKAKGRRSF